MVPPRKTLRVDYFSLYSSSNMQVTVNEHLISYRLPFGCPLETQQGNPESLSCAGCIAGLSVIAPLSVLQRRKQSTPSDINGTPRPSVGPPKLQGCNKAATTLQVV
jgi:hypothetical protein